ncbi:hypothetical protein PVAND_000373 [Polypedilum vanderplanki]|uniref:Uncharacterized protein n=1 Tax=Polypedilum vanderplanki TaxID=319348 RepID=A0A9J6BJM7_POLVA|nr:hypothetical protein PVAND_000373 [Polypedilum vanderplanki]
MVITSENEQILMKLLHTEEFDEDDFISFVTSNLAHEKWLPSLLNNNKRRLVMQFSINTLMGTEHPLLMKKIISFMFNIETYAKEQCCKIDFSKMLNSFYGKIISEEALSIVSENLFVPIHGLIIPKILLFYQYGIKAFTDYFEYDTLLTICERHLQNDEDPLYYQYARLETVLLKYMLNHRLSCMKNLIPDERKFELPLQVTEIIECAAKLRVKLFSKLHLRILNLYQASLLMSSIVDLLCRFKCSPMEYNLTKFIYIPKPHIPNLEEFVNFIEFYSFQVDHEYLNDNSIDQMYNDFDYQQEIIASLHDLCNNYNFTIDCTSFYKLIYYLGNTSLFEYIFTVLRVVIIKEDFPKMIGMIFSKFAINNVKMAYIKEFITNFNIIQKAIQKDFKFKICKYVISTLDEIMKQMKPKTNRFMILNYMQKFIESSLTNRERDILHSSLNSSTANMKLSKEEKKILEQFKKCLLMKVSLNGEIKN